MSPRLLATALIALLLTACQTPFGFGGDEWDGTNDTASQATGDSNALGPMGSGGAPTVLAAHAWCADGEPEGLGALRDGANVWVTHVGFSDQCTDCSAWDVQATTTGTDVAIAYTDVDATECDCDCGYSGIEFVMTGFTAEPWTIVAGDDSVEIDLSE